MNKQRIPWIITLCLALTVIFFLYQDATKKHLSQLTPNWNFSSATGPNLYQQLANSFVFVIKRTSTSPSWRNGDYGNGEYALFIIQRGTPQSICPAYSALSVQSSSINLDPFIGKAVLVTGFTQPDKNTGSIHVEHLELDTAVNEKLDQYREACTTPFRILNAS